MRILHIITKAERGGAQVHVLGLIKHQLTQGHEVLLLCGTDGFLADIAICSGAQTTVCPEIVHPIRPLHDLKALFRLRQHLRDLSPDIVHAHSSKAGMLARLACRIEKIPCVFTAHGWAFSEGVPFVRMLLGKMIERCIAQLGQPIITVSHYDRQLALSKKVAKSEQLFAIHNGMPDAPYLTQRATSKSINTLIMVARFANQKNPELLIETMPLLPDSVHCILVGDGPNQAGCRQLAKRLDVESRISFTGDSDSIPALLDSASIFVLLTHYEGLPLTIIEAMRAGLPVVASDVGGVSELVENGVTGYLVPRQAKPSEVADILENLLNEPVLIERMGKAARERYLNHFTEEIMMGKIDHLYQEITKKNS